jgi:hypothetical protein
MGAYDITVRHPNGLFEIVGHKSRFVKPFGLRISLDAVEQKLRNAKFGAACGANGDIMYVLVAGCESADISPDVESIAVELAEWLKIPTDYFRVRLMDEVPRLPNGKIDGHSVNKLITSLVSEESTASIRSVESTGARGWYAGLLNNLGLGRPRAVRDIFRFHFPNLEVDPDDTFRDLGGDSLSYLSVALSLNVSLERFLRTGRNYLCENLKT